MELLVLVVDEPVVEDAHTLVRPEVDHYLLVRETDGFGHEHALEDLGDVAQVESVMGLVGRGQQLGGNPTFKRNLA